MFRLSYSLRKEPCAVGADRPVSNADTAAGILRDIYAAENADLEDVEMCYGLYLSAGNMVVGYSRLSQGGVSSTVFDRRVVLRQALLCNAAGIILCHNHPSGNPRPSFSDVSETKALREACETLGVNLLDHIILTEKSHYSFSES